jgi:3-dehydroquinate synthase
MPPIRIDVQSAQHAYPVFVGAGLLASASEHLRDAGLTGDRVVVSVPPVWRHHASRVADLAGAAGPVLMADGERAKTLKTVARLYDDFSARHVTRSTAIVALGGGVAGDTAGFAAATYLRGLSLVHLPTTLLAQVDSAIGGKVGVNLPAGKNLAGAFHAPALVLIDPEVLATLPRREFRAGLYEVVKYAVIASPALFDRLAARPGLSARRPDALAEVIAECCRIKAAVVEQDERESGPRRTLNFGHTIGHALEAVTNFRRFRHGEAVACGMLAAARLSTARGVMPVEDEARLKDLIQRMGALPDVADLRAVDVLEAIGHDKKTVGGRLHFVLCAGIGRTDIVTDIAPAELSAAIASIGVRV